MARPEDALDLVWAERDDEAFELLTPLAHSGDARAQVLFGWMHQEGRGCDASHAAAELWYRASAEQGYAPGQFYLGAMLQCGGDAARGEAELCKAAEQDFLPALYRLAHAALRRGDRARGLALLEAAEAKGHLPAAIRLTRLVLQGDQAPSRKLRRLVRLPRLLGRFFWIAQRVPNDERVLT